MSAEQMTKTLSRIERRLGFLERAVGVGRVQAARPSQQKSLQQLYGMRKHKPISKTDIKKLRKQLWG